jgi:hypothetical protein
MAITQTGSVLTFNIATTNAGTASSTITVPADAEFVVVGWSGYDSVANSFSGGSLTFTKGGVDTTMTAGAVCDTDTGKYMAGLWYLALPDTGANKTLKWHWAGATSPDDGYILSVTFWKGVDTASPVRASVAAQAGGLPYTTASLTAVSGDLIIAWVGGATGAEGTINSWSNLSLLSQVARSGTGSGDGAWATGSPSGNTTVAASTATNFNDGGIVAISVKAAAAALAYSAFQGDAFQGDAFQVVSGAVSTGISLTPPTADLVLSETAPTILLSDHVSLTLAAVDLVFSPTAPALSFITGLLPAAVDLAFSSDVPALSYTTTLVPAAVDLAFSPTAPDLSFNTGTLPAAVDLAFSPTAPTVSLSAHVSLAPASVDLAFSSTAPTVAVVQWTPALLTGLVAWYKADVGVTTSAGNVTQVLDQSGNGYTLAPQGGNVPFNATGFRGLPAFAFVAANNARLETTTNAVAIGTGTLGSAFFAGRMNSATDGSGRAVSYTATGQTRDHDNTASAAWLCRNGSNNELLTYRSNGTIVDVTAISMDIDLHIGSIFDGVNVTEYIDNVTGSAVAASPSWGSPGTLAFGDEAVFGGGSTSWDGPIAEIVITNTALAAADRDRLNAYLLLHLPLQTGVYTPPRVDLSFSSVAPDVLLSNHVSLVPPAVDLVFSPTAPAAGINTGLIPAAVDLAFSPTAPDLATNTGLLPAAVDLVFSPTAPALSFNTGTLPAAVDLAFSPTAPALSFGVTIAPAAVDLAFSPTAPTTLLSDHVSLTLPAVDLIFSSDPPLVSSAAGYNPASVDLVFSPTAPVVLWTDNRVLTLPAVDLAFSPTAPALDLQFTPAAADLLFSPTVPAISLSDHVNAAPAAVDLTFSPTAPALSLQLTPATVDLVFSPTTPAISQTAHVNASPPTVDLAFTLDPPAVTSAAGFFPAAADLIFSPTAPVVLWTDNVSLTPAAVDIVFSPTAPTLSYTTTIAPAAADLIFSPTAPALDLQFTPAASDLAFSPTAPSLNLGISPASVDLAFSSTAPVLTELINLAPVTAQLVLSTEEPVVTSQAGVFPGAAQLAFSSTAPLVFISLVAPAAHLTITGSAPNIVNFDRFRLARKARGTTSQQDETGTGNKVHASGTTSHKGASGSSNKVRGVGRR